MNIFEIKKTELNEILDFYYFIEDYGHIFYGEGEDKLNQEFNNIISSINKIREIIDNNYSI